VFPNVQYQPQNWDFNPSAGPSSSEGYLNSTYNDRFNYGQNPAGNNECTLTKLYFINNYKTESF